MLHAVFGAQTKSRPQIIASGKQNQKYSLISNRQIHIDEFNIFDMTSYRSMIMVIEQILRPCGSWISLMKTNIFLPIRIRCQFQIHH